MLHTKATHPTARRHLRKALTLALSAGLLSLAALSSTAAPANAAAEDSLLTGVWCPNQDIRKKDWGWNPATGSAESIEKQRRAVVCLFNAVRAKVNAPKLSACSADATYCDVGKVARYTAEQVAKLTVAAQWKAMDVGYMCTTATGTDPHRACGRADYYWLDWWKANAPRRTPSDEVSYTAWAEILAPGTPSNFTSTSPESAVYTPRQVVDMWLRSTNDPSVPNRRPCGDGLSTTKCHREYLLDEQYHYVGVGVTPAWQPNGTALGTYAPYNWGQFRSIYSAYFIRTPTGP